MEEVGAEPVLAVKSNSSPPPWAQIADSLAVSAPIWNVTVFPARKFPSRCSMNKLYSPSATWLKATRFPSIHAVTGTPSGASWQAELGVTVGVGGVTTCGVGVGIRVGVGEGCTEIRVGAQTTVGKGAAVGEGVSVAVAGGVLTGRDAGVASKAAIVDCTRASSADWELVV